jgi:hypothetical protein
MLVRNGESTYNVPEGTKIVASKIVASNEPVEVDTSLEWKETTEATMTIKDYRAEIRVDNKPWMTQEVRQIVWGNNTKSVLETVLKDMVKQAVNKENITVFTLEVTEI